MAELGNTCGFLKNFPPLSALGGEDLVNLTLADDGIPFLAHTGIHEQLHHIPQPDRLAVDVILALSAAVIAPGNGNLRLLHGGENMLGIVDHQRDLGKAHLRPLGRAAEDHILHLGSPEALDALFSHYPADGVGDIGLSRAVGPHNGGKIRPEVQDCLIQKGFEALNFQCFKVHKHTSFFS